MDTRLASHIGQDERALYVVWKHIGFWAYSCNYVQCAHAVLCNQRCYQTACSGNFNSSMPVVVFIDFPLSNDRRFYSSIGKRLCIKVNKLSRMFF